MKRRKTILASLAALTAILALTTWSPAQAQQKNIILSTTPAPGLRPAGCADPDLREKDRLLRKDHRVGSGQAMAMGQKGEADVLLVHSPAAEKKFVAEGYGINRRIIMHNDFIVVGPSEDPARSKG